MIYCNTNLINKFTEAELIMIMNMDTGIYSGVFAVPACVVDKYLKLANGPTLKVLLVLLRFSGQDLEIEKISQLTNLSSSEVIDGLNFWKEQGLINDGRANVVIHNNTYKNDCVVVPIKEKIKEYSPDIQEDTSQNTNITPDVTDEPQASNVVIVSSSYQYPDQDDAAKRIEQCSELRDLLFRVSELLNKQPNGTLIKTLVMIYDWMELPADIIIMVVYFCKSIGIYDLRSITNTCAEFKNKGINTHEKADQYILSKSLKNQNQNAVKLAFGIGGRALSPKEQEYIDTWFTVYGYNIDFIKLAYNKGIDNTAKLSFAYINKILTAWHEKGIKTIEQAQQDTNSFAGQSNKAVKTNIQGSNYSKNSQRKYTNTSYDIEELERSIYDTPKL